MILLFLLVTCLASQTGVAATGSEEFPEASKRYLAHRKEVVDECITEAKSYKSSTSFSQNTQFAIAAAGVIAGAVIVPALAAKVAAKSVVAAWGGVAGAVNGLQYAWGKDGFSASSRAQAYKMFGDQVDKLLESVPATLPGEEPLQSNAWSALNKLDFYCKGRSPIPEIAREDQPNLAEESAKKAEAALIKYKEFIEKANAASGQEKAALLLEAQSAARAAQSAAAAAASASAAATAAAESTKASADKFFNLASEAVAKELPSEGAVGGAASPEVAPPGAGVSEKKKEGK